ncbi:MAG: ATP-binding protein [Oligoflexia bacterium]|nr:ATP-binding protein [Oligoflexia bacterium]
MDKYEKESLADYLSLWHFDNELLVYSDGSLGAGLKVDGMDIVSRSNEEINGFGISLENFINSIADGIKLQVFYRMSSKVFEKINDHDNLSKDIGGSYRDVVNSRLDSFKLNANANEYVKPEIYIFIRGQPINYKRRKIWEKEERFKIVSNDEYVSYKESFLKNLKQIEAALTGTGLKVVTLNQQKWFDLIYEYFNLSRADKLKAPILQSDNNKLFAPTLVDQLVLTDLSVMKDRLLVGDTYFQIITLKTMPEITYISMIEKLLKMPFNFGLSVNMEMLDQKKEMDKLKLKRRITHSFSNEGNNLKDLDAESKMGHIESLISELLESTEKIVSTDITVIIWSKNQKELEEKSFEVLRNFKELSQSEGLLESYPCFEVFINSWPGSCMGGKSVSSNKMKSSNLVHLLPIYSYWEGNDSPVCLFPNRNRALVGIDPFDFKLPNWNGLVVGSSGSGKSFSLAQIILMFMGQKPKPKVVWIDNGASSQNLVETLDGQFIEINLDSGICINMFDLDNGEKEPSPSKVKLILAVLENILSESKSNGLPKVDKAYLEEAIFKIYTEKIKNISENKTPTLSDFRELLQKHESANIKKYAQVLYSWTGKSAYGKLLDGQTNVSLEKDLVAVELKGLDVYPELQNVFLFLLTDFFKREATKDPKQKYLLILDESWRLFETESGAAFAVEAYRTFRKFNSAIWSISQNIHDFLSRPEIAKAVLQNTPSRIILKQRGIDWKEFKEILDLKDVEIEIIKSLRQEKGVYAEIYFIQDQNSAILMLEPDPLSYWICTTDPIDKVKINEVREKNPTLSKIDIFKILASDTKVKDHQTSSSSI